MAAGYMLIRTAGCHVFVLRNIALSSLGFAGNSSRAVGAERPAAALEAAAPQRARAVLVA